LKMIVFWDVAPCSLVDIDWRFRGVYCLHHRYRPGDGGSKHLWNVGQFLRDCTAQNTRRQSSLYSPPWEPEISPIYACRFQAL
jgi:hypothetical protein